MAPDSVTESWKPPPVGIDKAPVPTWPPCVVGTRTHLSECPWVGEGALFQAVITADARRTHSAITSTPCQLLSVPRKDFAKFEKIGAVLIAALRRADQRLCERLTEAKPESEDNLVKLVQLHTSGEGRSLANSAEGRWEQQAEHRRRFLEAQRRDEKAAFIYGLVSAYDRKGPASVVTS